MTDMTVEPYPPHDGWFAQWQLEDGSWATFSPTRDRNKALERTRFNRADRPDVRHRLIKETTIYTIDDEE